MKILVILFILVSFASNVSYAGKYEIILKDGTIITTDSYRIEGDTIYYPGSYGIESFVNESQVDRIRDATESYAKTYIGKVQIYDEILFVSEPWGEVIRGKVKNITDDKLWIMINYNLYDSAGIRIATTSAVVSNLKPGEIAIFETYSIPKTTDRYEISEVNWSY